MPITWFIKMGLLMVAVVATFLLFFSGAQDDDRIPLEPPSKNILTEENVTENVGASRMLNPRYNGEDVSGNTWQVLATEAVRVEENARSDVALDLVRGLLQLAAGNHVDIVSESGMFNPFTSGLRLMGNVVVKGYGYTLKTDALFGNMQKGTVGADTETVVTKPGLRFTARVTRITESGDKFYFTKGVRVHFEPSVWEKNTP